MPRTMFTAVLLYSVTIAGASGLLSATQSHAASITWGPATDSAAATDVSTNGTLVEAINATNAGGTVDINGVTFTNTDSLLGFAAFTGGLVGASTGDAGYDSMLDTVDWGNETSITMASGLLTPGEQYEVQVWVSDLRASVATTIYGDGNGNNVTLAHGVDNSTFGQYVIGTFTADGTSQTLAIVDTIPYNTQIINAYQVRLIPEPGSLALMGLSGLLIAQRRRR